MHFADQERRWRLVRRHHLDRSASRPSDVVEAVAALHSSDPLTPFLSCWARVPGFVVGDLEEQLYESRVLWRMHTIRRTLFVLESDNAPVFEAAATRELVRKEKARLTGWLSEEMDRSGLDRLLERLYALVLEGLGERQLSTRELTGMVPELGRQITIGSGRWAATVRLSSRVLYLMGMEGLLVRSRPAGTWRSSQYRWSTVSDWFGATPARLDEAEARVLLARRYLATHGPVTMADLRWWTGWTLKAARDALSESEVSTVGLEGGGSGLVLAGDGDIDTSPGPSTAFLPALDSTTMGWKQRDWYLGPHGPELFDTSGNAGPTVWVDGKVAGGWGQRSDGLVVYQLVEEVSPEAADRVVATAAALTSWLDGVVVMPRFPSPLGRRLAV